MQQRWLLPFLLAACGDNLTSDPPPDRPDAASPVAATCSEADLVATLGALPHVTSVAERDCGDYVEAPARCFAITYDQPVQHAAGAGPRFQQHLFLTHRGCDRPTLVADWGYSQEYFFDDELSVLYGTNALWIEHRYQGASVPVLADWDWSALTIRNGAADMHEIIRSFRTHYGARFVSTGASKGGITATYHHYLYPDDLDGAVPYVAPASRAPIDSAYQDHLTASYPPCAQQLRDAQVAALTTRRSMMQQRLQAFTPSGTEPLLLESMVSSFDWSFWQYYGVSFCNRVPAANATDDAFASFFFSFSGFGGGGPAASAEEMSWGALYYEWLTEQGFALQLGAHVRPHLTEAQITMTMEDHFREMFPEVTLPAYDGAITHAVRKWAREYAGDLLLIYGQYDPWSGGAMDEPKRATSARYFVPEATHNAQIEKLAAPDYTAALAHATRMFGVPPVAAARPAAARAAANRHAIVSAHDRRLRQVGIELMLRR